MGSRPSREDSKCQGDVGLDVTRGPWPGSKLHPAGFGELQGWQRGRLWVRGAVSSQARQGHHALQGRAATLAGLSDRQSRPPTSSAGCRLPPAFKARTGVACRKTPRPSATTLMKSHERDAYQQR